MARSEEALLGDTDVEGALGLSLGELYVYQSFQYRGAHCQAGAVAVSLVIIVETSVPYASVKPSWLMSKLV